MTTLAANAPRDYEYGDRNDLPVVADDIIFEGAAVGMTSGTARPLQAGDPFAGFAEAKADNSGGSAGDINVRVRHEGRVVLTVTGVDGHDDLGKDVYASDDNTFTLTASTNTRIGHVHRHISGTSCVVEFKAATGLIAVLTDNSGGTAADTIAAIGATYSQTEVRNAVASLAAKINGLIARLGQ